ncbi:MAG: hypothetical protein GPOALKHO_000913 [Sodalis sp.]|nr:MAG: hypothetical protein GPOALKHO_000913 [Sodalis sp.]
MNPDTSSHSESAEQSVTTLSGMIVKIIYQNTVGRPMVKVVILAKTQCLPSDRAW